MSVGGGAGMLRTRRRDCSVKPNRKLDRKSSRGMIYENEELRLRTIHINAEVEQGKGFHPILSDYCLARKVGIILGSDSAKLRLGEICDDTFISFGSGTPLLIENCLKRLLLLKKKKKKKRKYNHEREIILFHDEV